MLCRGRRVRPGRKAAAEMARPVQTFFVEDAALGVIECQEVGSGCQKSPRLPFPLPGFELPVSDRPSDCQCRALGPTLCQPTEPMSLSRISLKMFACALLSHSLEGESEFQVRIVPE